MTTTLDRWLAAINGHDIAALAALMAADFVFVDSLGNRVDGAAKMEGGWRQYFAMCPDYWITFERSMEDGDTTFIVGEAGGTIDGQPWRIPSAWTATVAGDRLCEWRVFADNTPVHEILAKRPR